MMRGLCGGGLVCGLVLACMSSVMAPAIAQRWRPSAAELRADPNSICLAYRLNDESRVRCGNDTRTIIRMRALFDFAIRGSILSVVTNTSGGRKVAILPPAPARRTPAATDVMPGGIYSSCGTVLAIIYSGPPAWDVLRGRPFYASRLKRPVCSDNLSVIAGLGEGKTGLVIEPGGTRLPYRGPSEGFGISPDGKYLAYYQYAENMPWMYNLCIKGLTNGTIRCQPVREDLMGYKTVLAVSDSGEVAFVQGRETNQRCYYYGASNQDVRHAPPGGEDECAGIFIASQSSPPKLAIPDGFSPPWVTRSNVDGLIAALRRRRK